MILNCLAANKSSQIDFRSAMSVRVYMIKRLQSSLSKLIVPLGLFSLMATAPSLAANSELRTLSISDLLKSHVLGERVQLEGRFVGQINYETVLFEDATGQIEVLIGEDNQVDVIREAEDLNFVKSAEHIPDHLKP